MSKIKINTVNDFGIRLYIIRFNIILSFSYIYISINNLYEMYIIL